MRFRSALDISPDGFTILHPERNDHGEVVDFTWVYENQAIARINGTDSDHVKGKRLLELFPSHKDTVLFNAYIDVAQTGVSRVLEDVYVGEIVSVPTWLRLVIVPLADDIAIFTQNITGQKIAQEELVKSEAKFRSIFEIASLGIAQVDASTGKITFINRYFETITGYTVDELCDMTFLELTHPDDRNKDWDLFRQAALGIAEYRNEKRYIKKDGSIIWVRLHVAFIRDEQGRAIRTVAICEDITHRKEAEHRLQDLADNLPGVAFQYILHPDGRDALQSVSKGSLMIWGYSPEEVENDINLVWDRTRAGGDFEQVKQSIVDAIATRTRWLARYRAVLPDGTLQTHLGSGTPTFQADGTVVFNSFVLDITKEVRQEQLLYQATEMAQIGSWEINLMNQSVTWSPIVYRLHETDSTTYIPDLESIFTFYRDDFRNLARTFFMKCIQTGDAFDFEAILITATKKERWVRVMGHAEQFGGQIKRIHGSIQDIHSQNVTKQQLKNTIKKLQDYQFALDKSASFTVTDTQGVITDVNDHFCALSQFSREELIGQTHHIINSNYHSKEFFSDFWNTIQSGTIWRGEVRNQKKDGTYYWADTTVVPFLDSQNKPFQYLALRIDITAKKLAEEKILKSYEKLKKIAWTESHVVRAPLARMLSIIQLIEARDQEEDIQVWFDHLKSSSLELDDIVTKIVKEAHVIED